PKLLARIIQGRDDYRAPAKRFRGRTEQTWRGSRFSISWLVIGSIGFLLHNWNCLLSNRNLQPRPTDTDLGQHECPEVFLRCCEEWGVLTCATDGAKRCRKQRRPLELRRSHPHVGP